MDQVGKYSFIAGIVLAVIATFVQGSWATWIPVALALLVLVVGILNVPPPRRGGASCWRRSG